MNCSRLSMSMESTRSLSRLRGGGRTQGA
jgi:hypothetical protein